MKFRYAARPRRPKAWVDDWDGLTSAVQPAITVHETDLEPEDTGLLDADGEPIYRYYEREPIGFVRDKLDV